MLLQDRRGPILRRLAQGWAVPDDETRGDARKRIAADYVDRRRKLVRGSEAPGSQ